MTALGVLCCFALFVCLTLLASFFLPSHLSLKTCIYTMGNGLVGRGAVRGGGGRWEEEGGRRGRGRGILVFFLVFETATKVR